MVVGGGVAAGCARSDTTERRLSVCLFNRARTLRTNPYAHQTPYNEATNTVCPQIKVGETQAEKAVEINPN